MNKELKISIPRAKLQGSAKPYWDLVRKHGTSRKKMVEFICGIGGYSDRDRYAIEFCIKDYFSDTDEENLWKLLCSDKMDVGPDKDLPPVHMAIAKSLFGRVYEEHKDNVWEWGRDEAFEGWSDSDGPYETFEGTRVEWKFEVHGRGGGHLCMTDCEGYSLKCSEEDLEEAINGTYDEDSEPWPNDIVKKLFIICVQNTVDLDSRKISEEIEYRAAWRLWVSFCEDELVEEIAAYENRQELGRSAARIAAVLGQNVGDLTDTELNDDFKAICKLADINMEE